MLISSLKIPVLSLLLLNLPIVCKAEDPNAPAKFYDNLPIATAQPAQTSKTAKYYTVKTNESLSAIAAQQGYNYLKLAEWNDIAAPYTVVAGQRLKLFSDGKSHPKKNIAIEPQDNDELLEQALNRATTKPKSPATRKTRHRAAVDSDADSTERMSPKSYVVGKNETLSLIALRLKVAPEQLAAWNDMTSPNQLYAGQKLKIFKNKQKHSLLTQVKKSANLAEISRDNSQKTSIISNNNKSMLKFYYHWPTKGKIIKNFSQSGGRGIEVSGKVGQAIKATAAGKVVAVSSGIYGHGGFIVIQHNDLILSSYANNKHSLVRNGQRVAQGQVIAEMGQVGHRPPSLEFEIRKNGTLVDPLRFLPKKI